jgi:hypothetical protein
MRNLYLVPALAVALTGASAAFASQAQQTAPAATTEEGAAPAPAKRAKPRKICREDDHAYSRMPSRTCKTQEEWDALDSRKRGTGAIPNRATQ